MAKVGRMVLAVLLGTVTWGILWSVGTQATMAAFPEHAREGEPLTHTGLLLAYIAYSVVLSVLAGFLAAAVTGGDRPMVAVWALAALQLAVGIMVEVSYWNLMPAWYHVIFLTLVVPATVWGGKLRAGRGGTPREATS